MKYIRISDHFSKWSILKEKKEEIPKKSCRPKTSYDAIWVNVCTTTNFITYIYIAEKKC